MSKSPRSTTCIHLSLTPHTLPGMSPTSSSLDGHKNLGLLICLCSLEAFCSSFPQSPGEHPTAQGTHTQLQTKCRNGPRGKSGHRQTERKATGLLIHLSWPLWDISGQMLSSRLPRSLRLISSFIPPALRGGALPISQRKTQSTGR